VIAGVLPVLGLPDRDARRAGRVLAHASTGSAERPAVTGRTLRTQAHADAGGHRGRLLRQGLFKTELIKPRGPWHGLADVELGTAEWVDWFNNQRLHTAIGDIPPHEHETNHYAQHRPQPAAGVNA